MDPNAKLLDGGCGEVARGLPAQTVSASFYVRLAMPLFLKTDGQ